MKILSFGFLLLLSTAVGCGSDSSSSGTAGAGGSAGAGGEGGAGGMAGMAGAGGQGGEGGMGGAGGVGGSGGTSGPPSLLSEWGLFKSIPDQIPEDGLVPYEVTSPLFTDDAAKFRWVQVPDGEQLVYSDTERWLNPAGTIYVKTFAYPVDATQPELRYQLIETRLLVFGEDNVDTWTYVYPEGDNDDAELVNFGPVLDVSWVNALGETISLDYEVPSVPQCKECHGIAGRSLGPSTGMFNRDNDYGEGIGVLNQIDYMNSLGMFDAEPLPSRTEDDLCVGPGRQRHSRPPRPGALVLRLELRALPCAGTVRGDRRQGPLPRLPEHGSGHGHELLHLGRLQTSDVGWQRTRLRPTPRRGSRRPRRVVLALPNGVDRGRRADGAARSDHRSCPRRGADSGVDPRAAKLVRRRHARLSSGAAAAAVSDATPPLLRRHSRGARSRVRRRG